MRLFCCPYRGLVTGSSSGIGKEITKTLAREGATVVVHGRNEERANSVVDEIRNNGEKAFVAIGDLSTDEGAKQVAEQALAATDGIDILINNAGGAEADFQGWMKILPRSSRSSLARSQGSSTAQTFASTVGTSPRLID